MNDEQERLIQTHLGQATSIAVQIWRTAPYALELDELKALAYYGLVQAAERWVPYCKAKGFSPDSTEYFKALVARRARGAILDELRSRDWATRSLRTNSRRLREAGQENGVSVEELSERSGLTVETVQATIVGMTRRPVSIEGNNIDRESVHTVESSAHGQMLLEVVAEAVRGLSKEYQVVLVLRHYEGWDFADISAMLKLPGPQVSMLHSISVTAVRSALLRAVGETVICPSCVKQVHRGVTVEAVDGWLDMTVVEREGNGLCKGGLWCDCDCRVYFPDTVADPVDVG